MPKQAIYPRWRESLTRSLHILRGKPESKFFQMANIDKNGDVQNRTLVFRGFGTTNNELLAITDIRSDKYFQLKNNSNAQICWYFVKTREQFRLNCNVNLITHDTKDEENTKIYKKVWDSLSESASSQFDWPHPMQNVSIDDSENALNNQPNDLAKTIHSNINSNKPHKHFVVLKFIPNKVDYLNLTTQPQTRELHLKQNSSNKWTWQAIHP